MDVLKFLRAIDGVAQLWAADGQFLGVVSSNQFAPNSFINPNTYGSPYNYNSITNSDCPYGGDCGKYSPYNFACIDPPIVWHQRQPVLIISKNPHLQTNGLPIVEPDLLLGTYLRLTKSILDSVQMVVTNLEPIKPLEPDQNVWNSQIVSQEKILTLT